MSFWNKFKTGLKIAKVGAEVALAFTPVGKATKIIEIIAKSTNLGDKVIEQAERGEK